jgi:hypothetical protein
MDDLTVKDLFPQDPSIPRRIYCDSCGKHMKLREVQFSKQVSGIHITVIGLLELYCSGCGRSFWPDHTRLALIHLWERAKDNKQDRIQSARRKRVDDFGYTKVQFLYDPDDYYYIPGLTRKDSPGFLTPVFFNKRVLTKFDSLDDYRLRFASRTYGGIYTEAYAINFGINENEKVVMWLGDIANLPESEQYYLRSENVPSDHTIGSEFYGGQIECAFTEPTGEDALIHERSEFLDTARQYFGVPLSHLDDETLQAIEELSPPVHFSLKEQRHFSNLLNRICSESLNSEALTKLLKDRGIDAKELGSLKKLQLLLGHECPTVDLAGIVSPLFVAYDLRVVHSHLTSESAKTKTLSFCKKRLGLADDAGFDEIYSSLITGLGGCYRSLCASLVPQAATPKPET